MFVGLCCGDTGVVITLWDGDWGVFDQFLSCFLSSMTCFYRLCIWDE